MNVYKLIPWKGVDLVKVQHKAWSLLNVISITQIVKKGDWLLPSIALKNQVVHNGIYAVGDLFYINIHY